MIQDRILFGEIYIISNLLNNKVYIGKVEHPRTPEDRWKEHLKEGRKLKKTRLQNPDKKISGTYLNNAIAKYGENVWKVTILDTAFNKKELNEKEKYWIRIYDSTNHIKEYNLTYGGDGGKPTKAVIEKIRKKTTEQWKNQDYRQIVIPKISQAIKERYKEDPSYRKKISRVSKERMKDPYYKSYHMKRLKQGLRKKRKDPEFLKKFSETMVKENLRRAKDPLYIQKQRKAHKFQRKKILNEKQFLEDIKKGVESRILEIKYEMSRPIINRNIRENLSKYGIMHYKDARKFLVNKDIAGLLKNRFNQI